MRTEIPAFRRFCLCVPLRYGLIVWGYLRLMLASYILVSVSFDISRFTEHLKYEEHKQRATSHIVILSLVIIFMIADIILGIIFIIGCHKKNASLIVRYYHHSLVFLALLIPLCIYNFGWTLNYMITSIPLLNVIFLVIPELVASLSYICLQIYIVLLVRSEILKLNNDYRFRFENKVAEAQCILNIEDTVEGTDAMKQTGDH